MSDKYGLNENLARGGRGLTGGRKVSASRDGFIGINVPQYKSEV